MTKGHALVPKLRFPEFRDAGDWTADGLVTVADFINEKIALEQVALKNYVSTENILAEYGGIDKASKLPTTGSVTRFQSNDTLVSNIRPYLKKVWVADKEGGASNDVIVIRAKTKLLPQYLSALLKNDAFIDYVMTGAKGVKMPRGDVGAMKAYQALYPPKPEQQKIADCLSSLDELIAAQARKVDVLKTHKKGLMQQLFPREGETQPRLRFPEFRAAKEWEVGPLNHFAQINPRREVRADDVAVSFVPMNAVSENGYLASPQGRNYGLVKKGFTAFQDSDVIVAKITPCFENGKAALVTKLINGIGFGSTEFHVVRANNLCLPEFMFAQIYSDQFRQFGKASMTGSGGQQRVPTAFVENYLLSVPSLTEQQRTADCLTSLDTFITADTQELEILKTHKKGLMQQLFPCLTND